jgi:2-polyprenyl-3-methyl-5-hydroxy-6-metoxy-1,4-benzoquinol methylase
VSIQRTLSAPIRAYFNPRFDAIVERLDRIARRVDGLAGESAHAAEVQLSAQSRIDVRDLNERYASVPFSTFTCQAVNAAHFDDPAFRRWAPLVSDGGMELHRKQWEYAFLLERARLGGVLAAGRCALGFGVGSEPIPAVLAREGLRVLATDQAAETAGHWSDSGEHAVGLASLSHPTVVDDATLARHVSFRAVDMNHVPEDLGTFDLVWSACAIEHLGSPDAGLDFVRRSVELLTPGGVAIHTTELELTQIDHTADYGHCAVYRPADLEALAEDLVGRGYELELNLHVPMASPADRYVALPPYPPTDPSHLKLQIFESVSTSFGLAIRSPAAAS